ncbi:hypothetical protein IGI39_003041 [Enterococcus sp. AZ135]|uniref:MarR family winged helix-turn-helix transcriptional regulator n=1 Tax=unclassified Enterococcus TaxID=2608891 RepID=UPI003F1F65FC
MIINQSLGYLLNTSARNIKSHLNNELKSAGITTSQWAILKLLSEKGTSTQVDIALNLKSDKATVGAVIERIEKRGLVRKEKSSLDRRAYEVILTNEGKTLVDNLVGSAESVNKRALEGLDQDQRKNLEDYLNKIISNLENTEVKNDELGE